MEKQCENFRCASRLTGTTREDELDGRKVTGLEYEAYEPMARSEFTKLCADIRERWPTVVHICVHHRLGCDSQCSCELGLGLCV